MSIAKSPEMFFKLDWKDAVGGVECKTLASISLIVDDTPIWPITGEDTEEFEWYADELLAHLTECWKPLILRQTYPIPVQPERPSFLLAEVQKRWSDLSSAQVENEQHEIAAFEDAHNLANAFGGISGLLPLWFLRDQDQMIIDTQERLAKVSIQAAIAALTSVGDEIANRLRDADKSKWSRLLEGWQIRNKGDGALLLALTIGRDRDTAETLIKENVLEPPASFVDAVNDNDEVRIAARMAGPLPVNQIKKVLAEVRTCHSARAPRLDADVALLKEFLKAEGLDKERPYIQGNEAAKWLRSHFDLSPSRRIEIFSLIERFGVDVRAIDFGIPSLDAIAVWGSKHGPAVLLNKNSHRVRRPVISIWRHGAIRVTAAHELCHLLLDAGHTLSTVDILGGRMPVRAEQRAKAFAAEFLLPSAEAASVWRDAGIPIDLKEVQRVITILCRKFGVTASVAAWQLEHGVTTFHQETLAQILDQIVPHR
jgi:Zn-dependent peptidase ImmA (M78 family)